MKMYSFYSLLLSNCILFLFIILLFLFLCRQSKTFKKIPPSYYTLYSSIIFCTLYSSFYFYQEDAAFVS